jgi:hypothetical protein
LVATRDFPATKRIADRILAFGPKANVTALVQHPDQAEALRKLGVRSVYDLFRNAGMALVDEAWEETFKRGPESPQTDEPPSPAPAS